MYPWVALVTLMALLTYLAFSVMAGRARGKYNIVAPAMTGHPVFERWVRIQANTLEWLVLFLPALWLFAIYHDPRSAAGLGVFWIIGRILYAVSYAKDPKTRGAGFGIQALATIALLLGALIGVVMHWR